MNADRVPVGSLDETQPYGPQATHPVQYEPSQYEPPPRGGCFSCGCLSGGCLGLFVMGLLVTGVAVYATYSFYHKQLERFTSTAPVELPSVHISDAEVEAIVSRLEDFSEQFEAGQSQQELIITLAEINALIAKNPAFRDRVYVTIVDGNLRADVSIPLDGIPGGKGRYFNGSLTLHVELEDGLLIANLVDAEANGQFIPDSFIEPFRRQNLAKEMYGDVELAKTLQRCERLIIEQDRIVLKVKQKSETSGETKGTGGEDSASASGPEAIAVEPVEADQEAPSPQE